MEVESGINDRWRPGVGVRAAEKTAERLLKLGELTTQDRLLGVPGGLTATFAELVKQLLVE
jgi:hypothetical protein